MIVRPPAEASTCVETTSRSAAAVTSGLSPTTERSAPSGAVLPSTSETRRSCIRRAAKLESAESTRQTDMLLIAAYIPTPSASSSAIESTWSRCVRASLSVHRIHSRALRRRLIADQRRSAISTWPPSGGPACTTRPLESSTPLSATRAISRLCVTTSTARPVCAWACSSSRIWMPVRKSSSPVGSSASSVGLPEARARAIATRCCSPPDSSCGKWRRRSPRPTRSSIWAAMPAASGRPATSAPNSVFSSAVSAGKRLKVWKTKLTP